MLIFSIVFTASIFFILFGIDELAIVSNVLGLIISLSFILKQKKQIKQTNKANKDILSTKKALNMLMQKKFQSLNIKVLKKEKNPYVTELKELSEAMQKQQNRIQKRTRKLQEKNIQNIQLLSTISHEIKNPLSIIQASIETISMYKDMDATMHDKLLDRIMKYSKKINALLNKLTLSESLEHNTIAISMEEFDIMVLCEDVIEGFNNFLLKVTYKDKQIILNGKYRNILADKILMEQVLNNLIHNALKYAKYQVTIHIQDKYIDIIDDGDGVAKSELNNLTKKYYQSTKAKQNEHSLGLGLFIVKEIAKIHNIKIEFFSKRSKKEGLCVRINI